MPWALCLLLALLLTRTAQAEAWTALYSSAPVVGADVYMLEKSVDLGVTWTVAAAGTKPRHRYTGTEPGLILFRLSACTATGCTVRGGDGLWHNEAWATASAVTKPGVK